MIEKKLPSFDHKDYYIAEVCQKPAEKAKTFQSILEIQSKLLPKPEKVIAYFSKDNFDNSLLPGDQLILLAKPQEIKNMGNPFEFDYREMMHNKGIDFSLYLSPGNYRKTGIRINRPGYWAEHVRDKLVAFLATTKIEKEERSVISALTLGYRTELEPQTRDYFASTGAMHVLAVSGLHIGLIYLILSFLLSGINRGKLGTVVYPIAMIIFLWAYAFITGFSPSVQRATVMFTFVIIGTVLRRPVNIYNSLSASALVLMLLNPNVLFEVGFQLSYLAVFGIVLIQPPLSNMLQIRNKILKWLWVLFTVSIAAQIATFPLGIFYFNQFPNFFWLSNFFVIPGATAIIWLTFGLLVLSPIPQVSELLAHIIQFVTHSMLEIIKWISSLPHAVQEGIVLNSIQVWMIFGLIGAFIIYGFSKNRAWLIGGLILFICFQANSIWLKYNLLNQRAIYVYHSKNTIFHFINGRQNYILVNGQNPVSEQEKNTIQNVCNHLKLKKPRFIKPLELNGFHASDLRFKGHTIRFLNCSINQTNLLKFNIQGNDLSRFLNKNPGLLNKEILNRTIPDDHSYLNQKQAFSIDFTSKFNEAVLLSLN